MSVLNMKWGRPELPGRGTGLGFGGSFGLLALAILPFFGAGIALAQESEDCNCDTPRIFTRGNFFSALGSRPMLGVSLEMGLDRELDDTGVLIVDVREDGPADRAGIRAGDIVTVLDGHVLTEPLEDGGDRRLDDERSYPAQRLTVVARDLEEGTPIEVEVLRDNQPMTFTVTPEELDGWSVGAAFVPDVTRRLADLRGQLHDMDWSLDWTDNEGTRAIAPQVRLRGGDDPLFALFGNVRGLELVELNPGLGSYFGTESGVLVANVDGDSGLGLEAGDVVVEVDGRVVEDPGHLRRILASYRDGDQIRFRIMRDGQEIEVSGEVR